MQNKQSFINKFQNVHVRNEFPTHRRSDLMTGQHLIGSGNTRGNDNGITGNAGSASASRNRHSDTRHHGIFLNIESMKDLPKLERHGHFQRGNV